MSIDRDIRPKIIRTIGSEHPINKTKRYLIDLLVSLGFSPVDGPEIESEQFNFDMLNIKKHILQDKCMIPFMLMKNQMFSGLTHHPYKLEL